jgi:hypothetical protein
MSTSTGGEPALQPPYPVRILRFGLPYRQIYAPQCADCHRPALYRVRFGKPARIPGSAKWYQKSRELCEIHYRAWRRRHGLPFHRKGQQPTTTTPANVA